MFGRQTLSSSIKDYRERVFLQVKRLFEYDPVPEEEFYMNPIKEFLLIEMLGLYDFSLYERYALNLMVCVKLKARLQRAFAFWLIAVAKMGAVHISGCN